MRAQPHHMSKNIAQLVALYDPDFNIIQQSHGLFAIAMLLITFN